MVHECIMSDRFDFTNKTDFEIEAHLRTLKPDSEPAIEALREQFRRKEKKDRKMTMFEGVILQNEQKELLVSLVEAARNIPKDKRSKFMFIHTTSESWVQHWGLPNWTLDCYEGDVDVLAQQGFLNPSYGTSGISGFDITPEGFLYYEELKQAAGEVTKQVEESIRGYLKSEQFQRRHPAAFQKWLAAEELLWKTDSNQQLSIIGHLCRESIQEFTDSLVAQFKPNVDPGVKALTKNRLKAVITSRSAFIPSTVLPFLDVLVDYWDAVVDLIQRQEHAGQREKESLLWEDARRVVFQTCVLMFEVDRILTLQAKG